MVLSDFVTAREREPGEGERGSQTVGKGMVCLWHKFMDRHAYMCLTARTLAMTGKNAHRFVDRWPLQCQRHLHKGAMCNLRCAPRDDGKRRSMAAL